MEDPLLSIPKLFQSSRDVQGDDVTPSIKMHCMEDGDSLIVLKKCFWVVGAVLPFYLSFMCVHEQKVFLSQVFSCWILNRVEFNWVLVQKSVSTSGGNCLHMFASPEFCSEFQIRTKLRAQRRTQPELPAQSDLGLELCKISTFSLVSNSYTISLCRSQEVF